MIFTVSKPTRVFARRQNTKTETLYFEFQNLYFGCKLLRLYEARRVRVQSETISSQNTKLRNSKYKVEVFCILA